MNDNISQTSQFINGIYDNLTYYDLYGSSVFLFFILTIIVILALIFTKVMMAKGEISSDWNNQRCKPSNIPFAGYIFDQSDKTAFEYTSENFQYCIQNVLLNTTEKSLQPFNFMIDAIASIFSKISESINKIRELLASIRKNMMKITEDVMNRVLNILIPLQTILVALSDTFNKTQGILIAGVYTALGSYYTLQALLGAIMELIIKMLVALVILIVGLWVVPLTQPMAATMSAVFLAISIPLAVILIFMKKTLHIESSKIPKLRCFDENTKFQLINGTFKSIIDLQVGNVLHDNSIVTSKIKVTSHDLDIYNLNGIIVSESHVVNYDGNWVPVKNHPNSVLIHNYSQPFLYCINTTKKVFELNGVLYTDWDEVYGDDLKYILSCKKIQLGYDKCLKVKMNDGCFKNICDVNIGDNLFYLDEFNNLHDNFVYGTVELSNLEQNDKLFNLLINKKYFTLGDYLIEDYNSTISNLLKCKK